MVYLCLAESLINFFKSLRSNLAVEVKYDDLFGRRFNVECWNRLRNHLSGWLLGLELEETEGYDIEEGNDQLSY